ncbi:MAG: choice-of-anchor tandem repeat GloVer-containing protein [Bryobacteraceae bacterium]
MNRTMAVRLSIALMVLSALAPRGGAQTLTTLYAFNGYVNSGEGVDPTAPLVIGADGVLFGTTASGGISNNGTVFALSPPWTPGDPWKETQIHLFTGGSDGFEPTALLLGLDGLLYGVTAEGGSGCTTGCGTAFSLQPDAFSPEGPWTKETYAFNQDIVLPGTLRSVGGLFYGTSVLGGTSTACDANFGCGALFALTPPRPWEQSWNARVLFSFPNGAGGYRPVMAALGGDGKFYATAEGGNPNCPFGCGVVVSLTPTGFQGTPPMISLTENVLHTFTDHAYDGEGVAGLVVGDDGVLYGVTSSGGIYGYGAFFSLTPPAWQGGPWTEKILYNFNGPDGAAVPNPGLVCGKGGVIYGTSYGILGGGPGYSGAVYSLTPPSDAGGSWTMSVLHGFNAGDDGGNPVAGVVIGDDGVLYGTTTDGGGTGKFGTVFALKP